MRDLIHSLLLEALQKLHTSGVLSSVPVAVPITRARDRAHGDFATTVALSLAKSLACSPLEAAEKIVAHLPAHPIIVKTEIAGPGFINFFLAQFSQQDMVNVILAAGDAYGHSSVGSNKKVMVEFVSANPTGPLHVGHGRGAVFGSVIANLLEAVGFSVHREYYVNDAGRQMAILATSVYLRYLQLQGVECCFPSNGYQGDYLLPIAKTLQECYGASLVREVAVLFANLPPDAADGGDKELYIDALIARTKQLMGEENFASVLQCALDAILLDIRDDLAEFGVTYDEWFSEKSLLTAETVDRGIELLKSRDLLYLKDNAWWFRSSMYGDEKDRVVLRANGEHTYFASDLFYHINKFQRGFELLIDVWGADHHGYAPRIRAGLQGLGYNADQFLVLLVQFAALYRGGEKVQMSTRSGSFVTLRELREEVGTDAARFFYLMRKREQHMDFDLDLAKSQSNENPLFYIQYAYARICSVLRQAQERGLVLDSAMGAQHVSLLVEEEETVLLSLLARYAETLEAAALQYEPHTLAHYLRELAQGLHAYYNAHSFLVEDVQLRSARLQLVQAVRQVIKNGLTLMGVSSRETM